MFIGVLLRHFRLFELVSFFDDNWLNRNFKRCNGSLRSFGFNRTTDVKENGIVFICGLGADLSA